MIKSSQNVIERQWCECAYPGDERSYGSVTTRGDERKVASTWKLGGLD